MKTREQILEAIVANTKVAENALSSMQECANVGNYLGALECQHDHTRFADIVKWLQWVLTD